MLVVGIDDGELCAHYISHAPNAYPFSSLLAIERHTAWLVSYADCGDVRSARAAVDDIEAIRAELADD